MPKFKQSTLSALIDSDSDDAQFVESMPTPDSAAENRPPGKKARGRPKVAPAKVTKTKAPARRTSGRLIAKAKEQKPAPAKGKRPALKDKTNQQDASEMEMDDFATDDIVMEGTEIQETQPAREQVKPKTTKKKTVGARAKAPKDTSQIDHSIGDTSLAASTLKPRATKRKAPTKKEVIPEPTPEKVIMETQVQQMEIDDADEEIEETITRAPKLSSRPRSQSRPRQPSAHRRRAGSASDTERNDPALRRKLGEVTKKYENLQLKYSDLREVGLKEAERNCERMKKNSEEKTKSMSILSVERIQLTRLESNDLIASLKADVASQTALAKESGSLKKKLESQNADLANLQTKIQQLTTSLSESQAENKTLSTKLAANRTVATSVESATAKVPGSAMKANGGIRMMGTAEAAQVAQAAQLKEDIYSDLTGLIIRNVKRESDEDVFDCIQTGRNGSKFLKSSKTTFTNICSSAFQTGCSQRKVC